MVHLNAMVGVMIFCIFCLMKMIEECWELFPYMRLKTDFAIRTKQNLKKMKMCENKIGVKKTLKWR